MFHVLAVVALMASGTSNICTTQSCVVYAETATDLYQIDPVALAQTHLCTFPVNVDAVNDIAVDSDGTLYALTAGELYTVNPSTCASVQVASVSSVGDFNGLSFLLDGRLIAVDTAGDVAQINTSTGSVTVLGHYGGNLGSSGDVVALSNGEIYATALDLSGNTTSDILVTLNPGTFAATVVGTISGYDEIYGLGYWAGVLYGFDGAGQVLKIDPSNGSATVAFSNPSLQWYGAGTTPLAPTTCQNVCTLSATACNNAGQVLTCQVQSSGCTNWVPSSCGSNQSCSSGQCVDSCSSTCIPFTGGCADSTHVQSCNLQSNGCFAYDQSACPANQVCQGGSCVLDCTNACTGGQVQCSGSQIQSCQLQASGCYGWVDQGTCGSGEICSSGQCSIACSDACTLGAAQCAGSFAQTCVTGAGGCTEWQNAADCGAAGCEGGRCCGCTLGATQCASSGAIEVCQGDPTSAGVCPSFVIQACASGACASGICLTACNPDSELNVCGAGAQCVSLAGGNYCGLPDGNGGYVPAPPPDGEPTTAGTSAGSIGGATTGLSGGSTGLSAGTTGLSAGTGGTDTGTTTTGGTGGAQTSTGGSSSSGGTGAQTPGGSNISSDGCGCSSASPASSLVLMLGLMGLLGVRRRR